MRFGKSLKLKITIRRSQPICDFTQNRVERFAHATLNGAFPDDPDPPASLMQGLDCGLIPRDIGLDFSAPEVFPRLRPLEQMAVVAMPEASMNEKNRMILREDEVRAPAQFPIVQPKTETAGMKPAADHQFRFRISPPYRRHVTAAGCCVMNVSQL